MDSSSLSSILDNSLVASLINEAKAAKLYAQVKVFFTSLYVDINRTITVTYPILGFLWERV